LVLCLTGPALGQKDDSDASGPLVRLLESTLSNYSQNIEVVGLSGVLNSQATIERLVISDTKGPWLTLSGAALDWNRLALLRGRFLVNSLSADRIEIARAPVPDPNAPVALPAPEAEPFTLPDLPVAIEISEFRIGELDLGEELIGVAARLAVNGNFNMADGALDTLLSVNRLDRPGDALTVDVNYANKTQNVGVDITLIEAAGGLLSTALNIPKRPSVVLTAKGNGPIQDFLTDIALSINEVGLVSGEIELTGLAAGSDSTDGIGFRADIGGDLTPLMAEEFHGFFGTDTALNLKGQRALDGRVRVDTLSITSTALDIDGSVVLTAEGLPELVRLTGSIRPAADGDTVVVPVAGGKTTIQSVQLDAHLDVSAGDTWSVYLDVTGLKRPDIALDDVTLRVDGTLGLSDSMVMVGNLNAALRGLTVQQDPTLSEAIGTDITLDGTFQLPGNGKLSLQDFVISAAGLRATAGVTIDGIDSGFTVDGQAQVEARDLSRFAALAQRPLSGSLSTTVVGQGTPLGGLFDLVVIGQARDLAVGIPQADALLAGQTTLTLDAERGSDGVNLRRFEIDGQQLTAQSSGTVQTEGTDLDLTANLTDLGLILPQYPGAATLTAVLTQDRQTKDWQANLRLEGPDTLFADVNGTLDDAGQLDGTYQAELPKLDTFMPWSVGPVRLDGMIGGNIDTQRVAGTVRVGWPEAIFATFDGAYAADGPTDLHVTVEMPQLEKFVPQLAGPARLDASLERVDAASDWITQLAIQVPEDINAVLNGTLAPGGNASLAYRVTVPKSENLIPQLPGAATLHGSVERDAAAREWTGVTRMDAPQGIFADIKGQMTDDGTVVLTYLADVPYTEIFVPQLTGLSRLSGQVDRDTARNWQAIIQINAPANILADIRGTLSTGGIGEASYFAQIPQVQVFAPDLPGAARFWGDAAANLDQGRYSAVLRANAPDGILANVEGLYSAHGPVNLTYHVAIPRLQAFFTQLPGLLELDGTIIRDDKGQRWVGTTTLQAPRGIRADLDGSVTEGGTVRVSYAAQVPQLEAFVPQLPGPAAVGGQVNRDADSIDWVGDLHFDGPGGILAILNGTLTNGGDADLQFDAEFPQVQRLIPDFPGTLTAEGTARRTGTLWDLDLNSQTPASGTLSLTGTYDQHTFQADLRANGEVQLGAANSFIEPNSIQGPLRFDLAMQGPTELNSVSGKIMMSDVTIAVPQLQSAVTGFGGQIALNNAGANIALAGDMSTGGGFRIDGPVSLAAPYNGAIDVRFLDMILTDQVVYKTQVGGGVRFSGPLTGNGNLSGQIDIGETEINIATIGGVPGAAPIPELIHEGEPADVHLTRERAGLVVEPDHGTGGGPVIGLDIDISMPNKIFVRGRGLDAELGGRIRIGGTTAKPIPSGEISLIRGRLGFLTRRLELAKGVVSWLGSLEPHIEFRATTKTSEGDATLLIKGPASTPDITVIAEPERPTEEALAMLVFGDQFTNLSPLRVAQLATGFARLAGGGRGLTDAARSGLGLSELDLTTDNEGNAAVGVGAYLSNNIYTDVTVNTQGDTELNLNLDVTRSFILKGSVDNQGDSSVGVFFERDY